MGQPLSPPFGLPAPVKRMFLLLLLLSSSSSTSSSSAISRSYLSTVDSAAASASSICYGQSSTFPSLRSRRWMPHRRYVRCVERSA